MKRLFCGLLGLCLCLSFTACGEPKKEKFSAYSFDYFDTSTTVTGYEESRAEFDRVYAEVERQLGEYHRLYDIYMPYEGVNNLYTVNQLVEGQHPTVRVDRRIIDLLLYAKEMYATTAGRMNVAMGSVLRLWHDYRTVGLDDPESASLPSMDRLEEAAEHTAIDNLVIDQKNSTVTLTDPGMRLDVGAIAKGYAVEQVARWLTQEGKTGYMLNVGGNVRAVGEKPDGTAWVAGLENPENPSGAYTALLELDHQALVTSGSYQRYYQVNGKRYHHIIHPDTLMPAEGLLSVSVVCDDSGRGDALSTALFCMTATEGKALVETLDGVEALWVAADSTRTTSSGWNQYLKK